MDYEERLEHTTALVLKLRQGGWSVKKRYEKVAYGIPMVESMLANLEHVNFRAKYKYGIWTYSVYTRNANGGYNKQLQTSKVDHALEVAAEFLQQEGPPVPVWDRNEIPPPFTIDEDNMTVVVDYKTKRKNIHIKTHNMLAEARCHGLVAITPDCYVNQEAVLSPGNKAWFLLLCSGNCGRFWIVSDGDHFYPVNKVNGKFKISLNLKHQNLDLSELNNRDHFNLRCIVKYCAQVWARDHMDDTK